MRKKLKLLIIAVMIMGIFFSPVLLLAQDENPKQDSSDPFGFGNKLEKVAEPYNVQPEKTLEQRVGEIISIVLSLLGVVFMILMIYAGFNWMTAGGDEEQISKSRNTIKAAIIGLLIVVAAYALSVFIIENLWGTGL
ncbi:MAG TPA: hypothetical protein PK720_02140 [bacterium]|nr:hypothetical protein [bacterium]